LPKTFRKRRPEAPLLQADEHQPSDDELEAEANPVKAEVVEAAE
jgi:hypothetical protein